MSQNYDFYGYVKSEREREVIRQSEEIFFFAECLLFDLQLLFSSILSFYRRQFILINARDVFYEDFFFSRHLLSKIHHKNHKQENPIYSRFSLIVNYLKSGITSSIWGWTSNFRETLNSFYFLLLFLFRVNHFHWQNV